MVVSDRERLEHHYKYEQDMLEGIHDKIRPELDCITQNALKESFCIHARCLIEFFQGKAKAFTESGYRPFFGNKNKIDKSNCKLNNQIAHLVHNLRTANPNDKLSDSDRRELRSLIATETLISNQT